MEDTLPVAPLKKEKHDSGMSMQQGRVQLDADWNEQVDIQAYCNEAKTSYSIGFCELPVKDASLGLQLGVSTIVKSQIAWKT